MRSTGKNQRGAALVTVLLFMTLTFILITSMLSVTGNEIVISGIQRDSTRALDLAQAGIDEAKMRIAEGRVFMTLPNWRSSIDRNGGTDPNVTVKVLRYYIGTNSAYLEIQSDATVGRARRKLSALVLQRMISFPPNITFAASVIEQGSAEIICGDAYARTFIQYKNYPTQAPGCTEPPALTYAGWRVSKVAPGAVAPCYANGTCVPANPDTNRWHPAQRRSEPATTPGPDGGRAISAQTNSCPAGGGGPLPADTFVGVKAESPCDTDANCIAGGFQQVYPLWGFDVDDPDGAGPIPPQTVIPGVLPCGFPYKYVQSTFEGEDGIFRTRWFKTIVFEQWFNAYWRFDEFKMTMVKRDGDPCTDAYCLPNGFEPNLLGNAKFGAVPPFPDIDSVNQNFDCREGGGGVLNSTPINCDEPTGVVSDIGCKMPEMSAEPACATPVTRPVSLVLDGSWTINGNLKGHGTIVVNGDLTVNGDFEYFGTIIVNGTMTLGAGSATIHGGLVADSTLRISGNINVEGGGTVGMVPTGRSIVIGRGWWER